MPESRLAADQDTAASAGSSPLKILFLGAAPSDASRLSTDLEIREIDRRIQLGALRDRCKLIQEWAVTAADLSQILLRHRPAIVHFSGHGTPDGRLVLLDAQGKGYPVPQAALTGLFALFRNQGLRCVVLSACFAEEQAQAISQHIEFTVGISGAIADVSATSFAAGFYSGLAGGASVRDAFALGQVQIMLLNQGQPEAPRLICRTDADPNTSRLL